MFIFRESYYLERMEPIKKPEEIEEKYQEYCSAAENSDRFSWTPLIWGHPDIAALRRRHRCFVVGSGKRR